MGRCCCFSSRRRSLLSWSSVLLYGNCPYGVLVSFGILFLQSLAEWPVYPQIWHTSFGLYFVILSFGCLYGVWFGYAISFVSLSPSAFMFPVSVFTTVEAFALKTFSLWFGLGLVRSCEFPLCGIIRHLAKWLVDVVCWSTFWYWYFRSRCVLISSGLLSSLLAIVISCWMFTGSFPNKNILMHLSASLP